MTQHVTEHDVRDIAEYTRIGLTDEEVSQMTVDLNAIIDSLAPITEYDLEGVEPTFHPIGRPVERHARRRGDALLHAGGGARERTQAAGRLASSSRPSWEKGAIS